MPVTIPHRGLTGESLDNALESFRLRDPDWEHGRAFGLAFFVDAAHRARIERAFAMFAHVDAHRPLEFASTRRMEAEVVRMTAALFHGDPSTVGVLTSGGTESSYLVVRAARERARIHKPKIHKPNLVLPETAHPAFDKACFDLGIEIRYSKLRSDFRADVRDLSGLIDGNTILLVGSAPQVAHGVVDPIDELGAIAQRRKIPLHVDASVGGYVLPWVERLGQRVPSWDFRVPGVTSISADLYKFGYGTKGANTLLYRDMEFLKHQFFVSTDWPGGIFASATVTGTRSAGAVAAAWTSLVSLGEEGFLAATDTALRATRELTEGLTAIPELEVLAKPDCTLIAYRARRLSDLSTHAIADRLEARDFHSIRQQNPPSIRCVVTPAQASVVGEYLSEVRDAVDFLRTHAHMQSCEPTTLHGTVAQHAFAGSAKKVVESVFSRLYGPHAADPDLDLFERPVSGGMMMRLMRNYGGRARDLLERVDDARESLGFRKKRRS